MSHVTTTWPLLSAEAEAAITAAGSLIEPGIDWALDSDGDLIVPMRYTRGLEATAQGIRIRIQMFKGEWFLDTDLGVPYMESATVAEADALLGQKFNELKALSAFRRVIAIPPGVQSILALAVAFDRATRVMRVEWRVRSAYGVIEDSLEV